MMRLFDTHAHYDDISFDADRNEVLENLYKNNVSLVLNPSTNEENAEFISGLTQKFDFLYAAVGVHPSDVETYGKNTLLNLEKIITSNKKIKAIGEIGLDYHYDDMFRDRQREIFKEQLDFARSMKLPAIIHEREATKDCLDILKDFKDVRCVIHCYSGSVETARELLNLGHSISFTGIVTFNNARKSLEAVKMLPQDRFMIETDSPYMTPVPHRGKRNDSSYLSYIAQKIAEVRETDCESIAEITYKNGVEFFKI